MTSLNAPSRLLAAVQFSNLLALFLEMVNALMAMIEIRFSSGKCHIWYSTCVYSFSTSPLAMTAAEPGSAGRSLEVRKSHAYEGFYDPYIF